jgi:hypothetical protein
VVPSYAEALKTSLTDGSTFSRKPPPGLFRTWNALSVPVIVAGAPSSLSMRMLPEICPVISTRMLFSGPRAVSNFGSDTLRFQLVGVMLMVSLNEITAAWAEDAPATVIKRPAPATMLRKAFKGVLLAIEILQSNKQGPCHEKLSR